LGLIEKGGGDGLVGLGKRKKKEKGLHLYMEKEIFEKKEFWILRKYFWCHK
jgi:hypothetical protein